MAVRIKVDGVTVEAEVSESVLVVARRAGAEIPTLCYHESVPAIGACRLCLVEIKDGDRSSLTTSCDAKVAKGMEIVTDSPRIRQHRAANIEMILARAPQVEVVRGYAREYGVTEARFRPVSAGELENCILCELCVRVCEALGHQALATVSRGGEKYIGTPFGKPAESCVGCGACAAVCPTKCIPVTDSKNERGIWGQTFRFVACEVCGDPILTEKHRDYAIAQGELPVDYYLSCAACKKKQLSLHFAKVGS